MLTDFRLSDALFVKAKITRADKVSLWLGANVMLEYETSEALALLTKNEQSAQTGLAQLDEDMVSLCHFSTFLWNSFTCTYAFYTDPIFYSQSTGLSTRPDHNDGSEHGPHLQL